MTDVPDEVRALAAERQDRRTARDFAAADALRDRIRDLGFNVIDGAEGPTFEPVEPEPETRLRPHDVESLLELPPTADVSVHWVVEGWPEDVVRSQAGGECSRFARKSQTEAGGAGEASVSRTSMDSCRPVSASRRSDRMTTSSSTCESS